MQGNAKNTTIHSHCHCHCRFCFHVAGRQWSGGRCTSRIRSDRIRDRVSSLAAQREPHRPEPYHARRAPSPHTRHGFCPKDHKETTLRYHFAGQSRSDPCVCECETPLAGRDGYSLRSHGEPGDEEQPGALEAEGSVRRCAHQEAPVHRQCHPAREGNVPGGAAHQRRPVHREPGDAGHLEPARGVVPLQPAGVPHRREPAAAGHRGGPGARLPPRGAVRAHGPAPQHARARPGGRARRRGPRRHPQRLPHHVRRRVLQRGGPLHGAHAHAHGTEEGRRQAADRRRMVQVHRRVLLRWHLRRALGLLPPLRARPPLLLQVEINKRCIYSSDAMLLSASACMRACVQGYVGDVVLLSLQQ